MNSTQVLRDADLESFALRGHGHRVTCLCLLPDGRVASGSGDASVRVSEPRLMNPVLEPSDASGTPLAPERRARGRPGGR